jgi:hypothetical protein
MIDKSDFLTKMEGTLHNEYDFVEFDRSKIDGVVIKRIAPFYKNYPPKYVTSTVTGRVFDKTEFAEFSILLYAKPDGKVCELAFEYDKEDNIPMQAIEKLENEILSMDLTLEFNPNSYYTKSAIWVSYPVKYSVPRQFKKYLQSEKQ